MRAVVAAVHGILTGQTDASWPDRFEAWMWQQDPEVKVLKKEYRAGPFPRWNCWVKDPLLARGLVNEIELYVEGGNGRGGGAGRARGGRGPEGGPEVWLIAHSNGAVIALIAARLLIARGHRVAGLILTGAAVEADVERNGVWRWLQRGQLRAAIAYSSEDDAVVAGDGRASDKWYWRVRDWVWGKLMWPYGSLGRTGWMRGGKKLPDEACFFTRWYQGGHTSYFEPGRRNCTFMQAYQDMGVPIKANQRRLP
jgi:hypothetical protein